MKKCVCKHLVCGFLNRFDINKKYNYKISTCKTYYTIYNYDNLNFNVVIEEFPYYFIGLKELREQKLKRILK